MDPQQRVLLDETVAAFRGAGHSADALLGSPTGVFVRCIWLEYGEQLAAAGNPAGAYMVTGQRQLSSCQWPGSPALRATALLPGVPDLASCLPLTLPCCCGCCPCRKRLGIHGGPRIVHTGPGGPLHAHQHRLLLLPGGLPPGGTQHRSGKYHAMPAYLHTPVCLACLDRLPIVLWTHMC